MGYSARYHAASLAAVFVALAVGILIGVGFGSDLVSGTAEDLERSLEEDLGEARQQIDELELELADERRFGEAVAPAVVEDRLRGREIAIVALGELEPEIADDIRGAVESAGAELQEIAVVREPPDTGAAAATVREQGQRIEPRGAALTRAAQRAGRALVRGGERFAGLRGALFGRYSGEPGGIDGVVVVRRRPEDLSARAAADTDRLEEGLLEGITGIGPPPVQVVGVERTDSDPSSIEFYSDHGTASVDNVDQLPGRVALVYALGGAEGAFGVKETADALLPDLLAPANLGFGAGAGAGD
jgi:Copper transport outer membrane protein, MctB